jgi:hypothetical protein
MFPLDQRIGALLCLVVFLAPPPPAMGQAPAAESGACTLEGAEPATVAAVDEDFDLLLDDGRRATLAGLEFPPASARDLRAAVRRRLADWLVGREVFIGAFAVAPDRWGRIPARLFAAKGEGPESPLVSVGSALLEAGEARFRPDASAESCATPYQIAEQPAREALRGVWLEPAFRPIDLSHPGAGALLLQSKGMTLVSGRIHSLGETREAFYLNFGEKRMQDFSVVISRRNLAMFARSGISLKTLIGRQARVRGLIDTGFGPRMQISTPAEIEIVLDTP